MTRHSYGTSMLAPLLPLLWLLPAARGFGNMEDGTGRAELCDVRRGAGLCTYTYNTCNPFNFIQMKNKKLLHTDLALPRV